MKAASQNEMAQNSPPANLNEQPIADAHAHPKALISSRFSATASSEPTNLQASQLPFIAEVKSKIQNGGYKLQTSPCPCGAPSGVVISEIDRYRLPLASVLCAACGTVRIDPYLDEQSLEDFYTHSYQEMYARAANVDSYFLRQKSYGEKVLAVVENLKPGSWVFEVGCGAGGALNVFQSKGFQVAGCDYSAELIAAGRQRGVRNIYHGTLDDIESHLDGTKADLIYLHHVFEHVQQPLGLLAECRNHLAPGGKVIIIVPDISQIGSYLYPAGDLLQMLHIAHKHNFSFIGLRLLALQAGYKVRRLTPDPRMQTPTSRSPELWVELIVDEEASAPQQVSSLRSASRDGNKILRYLKRTEKLYSLGLCRGQQLERLNSIERNLSRLSRVTPAKVIRKLKGSI